MTEICSQLLKELSESTLLELFDAIKMSEDKGCLPQLLKCLLTGCPQGPIVSQLIITNLFDATWLMDGEGATSACKLALEMCEQVSIRPTAKAFELKSCLMVDDGPKDIPESLVRKVPLAMILEIIDAVGPRPSLGTVFNVLDKDAVVFVQCLERDLVRYLAWRVKFLNQATPEQAEAFLANVYDKMSESLASTETSSLQQALYSTARGMLKVQSRFSSAPHYDHL